MPSTFTAVSMPSGEAFFLETERDDKQFNILVDAGLSTKVGASSNPLYAGIITARPDVSNIIDIAICTHSDNDHAGGFPAFIETWLEQDRKIGEVWLPARWLPAVHDALTNPDLLVTKLMDGAVSVTADMPYNDYSDLGDSRENDLVKKLGDFEIEHWIRSQAGECLPPQESILLDDDNDMEYSNGIGHEEYVAKSWGYYPEEFENIKYQIEEIDTQKVSLIARANKLKQIFARKSLVARYLREKCPSSGISDGNQIVLHVLNSQSYFDEVLEIAERIRQIAIIAVQEDIPVRWFDFSKFENNEHPIGGVENFLVPLNSVEVLAPGPAHDAKQLFFSLKLSKQNVESLIFQKIETSNEPSVIFTGDSRFAFGVEKPTKDFDDHLVKFESPCLYTAAHHGSRNNDRSYEVLEKWMGTQLFEQSICVRNGGLHNQKVSKFLTISNRVCANCYQCIGGKRRQKVVIQTFENQWIWPPVHSKCGQPKSGNAPPK